MPHFEGSHSAQDVQGHVGYFRSVTVAVGNGKSWRHHVSIADGLHLMVGCWWEALSGRGVFCFFLVKMSRAEDLVDVVVADDGVKDGVEVVEEVHHLDGLAVGWDGGEAHDVAKVNGHAAEMLRFHDAAHFQSLGHRPEGEKVRLSPAGGCGGSLDRGFNPRERTAVTFGWAASLSSASQSPAPLSSPWWAPPGWRSTAPASWAWSRWCWSSSPCWCS